jgi:hypothetical protein
MISQLLWCPMQPRPDPRLPLVLPHLEDASGSFDLSPHAPTGNKCARKGSIGEVSVLCTITQRLGGVQPLGPVHLQSYLPPRPRSPATAPRHLPLAGVLLGCGAELTPGWRSKCWRLLQRASW